MMICRNQKLDLIPAFFVKAENWISENRDIKVIRIEKFVFTYMQHLLPLCKCNLFYFFYRRKDQISAYYHVTWGRGYTKRYLFVYGTSSQA